MLKILQITTPHRNTIFLTKSLIQTISTKMLSWKELDSMDHFAWGVENKRSRASCLLDVSSETYDTLRMICGDEVCFFFSVFLSFFKSLKFYLKNNRSQFFCCRRSKRTLRGPAPSPCWMCLPFGRYVNTSTGWLLRAWEPGGRVHSMRVSSRLSKT